MASVAHQLKDKLRTVQDQGGKVAFGTGANAGAAGPAPVAAAQVTGDVSAKVPQIANADPLIEGSVGASQETLGEDMNKLGDTGSGNMNQIPLDSFTETEIVLTEAERDAFLEALVENKRYEQKFSLFNGKIKGRLRSRSTEESEAIASWMNWGVKEQQFKSGLDYAVAMRNALLAAQVLDLNGTRFPELKAPLYRTQDGDKTVDPGWLGQMQAWSQKLEPVVAAVYQELRTFEKKYWTMVMHARDQNFWRPAESTSR